MTLSAKGGHGGNTVNAYGQGGGGGGGFINISSLSIPSKIDSLCAGGVSGTFTGGVNSSVWLGKVGEVRTTFIPTLNGFLFNSIRSEVTGDQVDSICSNMVYGNITGTVPVGGVAPHTFQWQKSITSGTTGYTDISGATDKDYSPGLLTVTTWFRRIVRDSDIPVLEDISLPVQVIVQPFIENNIVGNPDTICYNGDPPLLQQLTPDLIVPTTKYLFYSWQDSSSR